MDIDTYISKLSKKLGKAKRTIIEKLWGNGESFPGKWISSKELLNATGQKYFDRRTRELRDELGCEIETSIVSGIHSYRLASTNINPSNPRKYLTPSQKTKLFAESDLKCQVCGKECGPNPKELQADHKVPLSRGGEHGIDNWQALCIECNVLKRSACQDCKLDCKKCSWAFPKSTSKIIPLRLTSKLFQSVQSKYGKDPIELEKKIIALIETDTR